MVDAFLPIDAEQIDRFADALLRYASEGVHISLRAFHENRPQPLRIEPVRLNGGGVKAIAAAAIVVANQAASHREAAVFCPPIAGFNNPQHAREVDLAEAYALSVECDAQAAVARAKLEALLGPATVVVASGGDWVDPDTGVVEPKLHLHWRLAEPATGEDLVRLKEARRHATAIVGGDASNVPAVHPIRWPGSIHRKKDPRLTQIIAFTPDAEIELGDVLELLAEHPDAVVRPNSPGAPQAKGGSSDADYASLVRAVLTGDIYHDSLIRLAAKMVASCVPAGAAVNMLRGFMEASSAPRDQRWQVRYDDIPRTVNTAVEKFSPPASAPILIQEERSTAPRSPEKELPEHLLTAPGLTGQIVRWILGTARYPQPALAMAAALSIIGTAAGRKYAGPTGSGTHLFVLALAPTGAGKNHAPKVGRRLMQAADLGDLVGPREFNSASAVWQTMERKPGMICWMDELGAYLGKLGSPRASGHERTISAVLRTLWGESFGEVAPPAWADHTGRKPMGPIYAPALTLYGTSVPEEFYAALSSADVTNGFLNRFLLVSTQRRVDEVDPLLDEYSPPDVLTDELTRIFNAEMTAEQHITLHHHRADPPRVVVPWAGEEVRAAYKAFRRELDRREEDASFMTRTAEMAVRIATILAIGRRAERTGVTLADWEWARDLALWSAERMIADAAAHMVENEDQRRQKLVLRYIREAPDGCITRSALTRKIDGRFSARVLTDLIETLTFGELIAKETMKPPTGRPGEGYRALSP